jgi:hypothetical protein
MSNEAALEALPTEQLRDDVTRLIAKRLAPMAKTALGQRRTQTGRAGKIVVGDHRIALNFRTQLVSEAQLIEAVHAALGEVLGRESELLVLRNADPELAPVMKAVFEQVPRAVRARRQALTEQHIDALVDVYMANDPLAAALPDLEHDNAEAQATFLKQWPVLTGGQLAERAGHGSNNVSATASRWKAARKIFGVRTGRREVYPAFQFKGGQPRPVVGEVLTALPNEMSGWQTALWFVGANSWLEDDAPADRLDDAAQVIEAARHEGEAWSG